MARTTVPQQPAAKVGNGISHREDGSVSLSSERSLLCLEATWEIEALAQALPDLVPLTDETEKIHYLVRGVAARIYQLNGMVMGGINDELETVGRIRRVLTMKLPEVANV